MELAGEHYFQIQLIGNADGPVAQADRKYHLLKVAAQDETLEMRTLNSDVIGKHHGDSTRMIAAFVEHKSDPKLFDGAEKFRRVRWADVPCFNAGRRGLWFPYGEGSKV